MLSPAQEEPSQLLGITKNKGLNCFSSDWGLPWCEGVEPDLQPITNETLSAATANTSEGARLDIAMNGFWGGRFEKTFVDVRVFNPTVTQQSPHATKNMKTRRKGHTIKELERWNMQRLHPSFFQLPVVYRGRQLFSTSIWQVSRPTNHTAKPWTGSRS